MQWRKHCHSIQFALKHIILHYYYLYLLFSYKYSFYALSYAKVSFVFSVLQSLANSMYNGKCWPNNVFCNIYFSAMSFPIVLWTLLFFYKMIIWVIDSMSQSLTSNN